MMPVGRPSRLLCVGHFPVLDICYYRISSQKYKGESEDSEIVFGGLPNPLPAKDLGTGKTFRISF